MSRALNATGRPIVFSLCSWGLESVWKWGPSVSQMFRIQTDHLPLWRAPPGTGAGYGAGVADIIEWMAELVPSKWVKSYGWPDPDFLMTLYPITMDYINSRTEYTFWSLWSSPLLVSTDIRRLSPQKKSILMNAEVIAIDQDPSFTAGDRVRNDTSGAQVWSRDLSNGDKAVVLFNGGKHASAVAVTWAEIGWGGSDHVKVRDLWARTDNTTTANGFECQLVPHDVCYLRLTKVSGLSPLSPSVFLPPARTAAGMTPPE